MTFEEFEKAVAKKAEEIATHFLADMPAINTIQTIIVLKALEYIGQAATTILTETLENAIKEIKNDQKLTVILNQLFKTKSETLQ